MLQNSKLFIAAVVERLETTQSTVVGIIHRLIFEKKKEEKLVVSFILFLKKREQIDFVLYYDAATVAEEQIFMGIRWFPGRLA